jgi:2-aminoethylphosphonate-pyruvate transaminase
LRLIKLPGAKSSEKTDALHDDSRGPTRWSNSVAGGLWRAGSSGLAADWPIQAIERAVVERNDIRTTQQTCLAMNEAIHLAKPRPPKRQAARRANSPVALDVKGAAVPAVTDLPAAKDKTLFTPGPLTTSLPVKQAMLRDAGSWHFEFNAIVASVRERLLRLAGLSREAGFESILLQGSGTFGVEAVFATGVPPDGKVLVLVNGAYGERIVLMLQRARITHLILRTDTATPNNPVEVERQLAADNSISHVAVVHCETTTGILNPIEEIGKIVRKHGRSYIVDAMSSFGAIPIDFESAGIDYLVSSANKCIEGVPGFCFVIARRSTLLKCEGHARSLSLDLLDQLKGFEKNGQFRYTPPTHAILAFQQALNEFDQEGGVQGRAARYQHNHTVLVEGMKKMGFRPYLSPRVQSYIITSFHYPDDPKFSFHDFYCRLSDRGFIIYPGKLTQANCFRVGSIGRIFESDVRGLLAAIRETMEELHIRVQNGEG